MAKLTTSQIWNEWQKFRKDFGQIIHRDDLMEINYEFELDKEFFEKDVQIMLNHCDKVKTELTNIRESIK